MDAAAWTSGLCRICGFKGATGRREEGSARFVGHVMPHLDDSRRAGLPGGSKATPREGSRDAGSPSWRIKPPLGAGAVQSHEASIQTGRNDAPLCADSNLIIACDRGDPA